MRQVSLPESVSRREPPVHWATRWSHIGTEGLPWAPAGNLSDKVRIVLRTGGPSDDPVRVAVDSN
jgi:hypothetical protein